MSEVKRERGRPATIDADTAMQAVVELFRSKGYAAVSLDELSDVTGLSRPSLYRSFGNKLSMYLGAIDAFVAQAALTALPALQAEGPIETALANFYREMLAIYFRDDGVAPGCLVFGTAPSSADEGAIKSRLFVGIESLDATMRKRMQLAAPNCDESQLDAAVDIATNTLIAFSARAKSGADQQALEEMGIRSAVAIARLLKG